MTITGQWRDIADAPPCEYRDGPKRVLLYGPLCGVREGRAGKFPDGSIYSDVPNVNGDIGATHYMPLPEPPAQPDAEKSQ